MRLYSREEIVYIVEDFLAKYLNLGTVYLKDNSVEDLDYICNNYGTEVENIVENND